MPLNPPLKWILRAAVIPAVIVGYVTVAGLTGFCPTCKSVVDGVLGRHGPMERPDGAAPTITGLKGFSLEGDPVELASLSKGKPMIIEVWATWCGPCREQRTIVHGMADELKQKATLVSLSVDNDPRTVSAFLKDHPSEMAELMAPEETLDSFGGVSAVPTLVFVDAQGAIRGVEAGVHSASLLRARIDELAAGAALSKK
jgi:cytochrome c biogenesis protein CcmG/thiol:disulfide interchange protein DsbE